MYKSIFLKNNTDDSRTVVESKGITYLPLDFSSKQSEEKETYKNPLEWLFSNLNSFSNTNSGGTSYDGYNPRYTDFSLDANIEVDVPDTFSSKEEFKSVMLPLYEQVLTSRGLDPSFARVLVAQDGLETNWGKSTIGNYNYGNITGSSGKNKVVSEYINGAWTTKSQTFVNYDNATDYINAKIDLLSKPRYDVFSHPVNEFAQRVKGGGYATAPNYVEVLNNTIRTLRKGGILKFDGGGEYLEQEREHYNQQVNFNSLLPVFNIPYNLTKHKLDNVRVKNDAPWLLRDNWDEYNGVYNTITNTIHINDNYPNPVIVENHEKGHIIGQPLVRNVENLIKKWDGDIFEDGVTKDSYYDSPKEILARMYAYLMDSGYGGNRTIRDTLQFIRNERDRFTTEINADLTYADGTRVRSTRKDERVIVHDKNIPGTSDVSSAKIYRKYNDPYDIFNRYNDRFINDLFQLFYSMKRDVQLSRNGGIIKKYNTGGPVSWTDGVGVLPSPSEIKNKLQSYNTWTMVDNWHPPMLPSYVNSKPDAESSVLGFENAKEVYEYILSLPGSNPAIAAGWTGVFMKESGLDHNAVNESSGASGIAQLLGTRRTEYKKWLKDRPDNWQNQISWVWEKVNNGIDDWQVYYDALKDKVDRGIKLSEEEAKHWNSMKNSKYRNYSFQNYRDKINDMYDPGDIVELMTWTFERPGSKEAHIDQRREYANAVYNQFN